MFQDTFDFTSWPVLLMRWNPFLIKSINSTSIVIFYGLNGNVQNMFFEKTMRRAACCLQWSSSPFQYHILKQAYILLGITLLAVQVLIVLSYWTLTQLMLHYQKISNQRLQKYFEAWKPKPHTVPNFKFALLNYLNCLMLVAAYPIQVAVDASCSQWKETEISRDNSFFIL